MSWLHAVWLTWRAVTGITRTAIETYVIYVMFVDFPRFERAWRVLRGRA